MKPIQTSKSAGLPRLTLIVCALVPLSAWAQG